MPLRKILRGVGAGRYLSFAIHRLHEMRKHNQGYAFKKTISIAGAEIQLRWVGQQETVIIQVGGEDFAVWSVLNGVFFTKHPTRAFRIRGDHFSKASPDIRGNFQVGDRTAAWLAFDDPPPTTTGTFPAKMYLSPDWAVSGEPRLSFNAKFSAGSQFGNFGFTYAGLVRDPTTGVVTGKRFLVHSEAANNIPHVHRSSDTGVTWSEFDFPNEGIDPVRLSVSSDFVGNNVVLAFVSTSVPSPDAVPDFVSKSIDGGLTWAKVTGDALATYLSTSPVYLGGLTTDSDKTAPYQFLSLGNNRVIALNGASQNHFPVSFLSTDGGLTFNTQLPPRPQIFFGDAESVTLLGEDALYLMQQDPNDETKMLFWRSLDGGLIWSSMTPPKANLRFPHVGFPRVFKAGTPPVSPDTSPAATRASVALSIFEAGKWNAYVSIDGGLSWEKGGLIMEGAAEPPLISQGVFLSFQDIVNLGPPGLPAPALPALPGLYDNPN